MIAWRETCAEREVSGQHSPRGRPFPRLSARLSACRGDSPAPVRPNMHRGTCPLVRGFRRAKTLTMQPVRLCVVFIGPRHSPCNLSACAWFSSGQDTLHATCLCVVFIGPRHSPCNLSACAVTSGQTNAHRPKNLSTYVVISSQTLTEEPVCLCGYIEPNTHRETCLLVWLHRAKHSQRNLSACVVTSSQILTEEPVCLCGYIGQHTNIEEPDTHPLSFFNCFFIFFIVFLYGYTETNIHKGTCPLVWLHRAKHSRHPYAPAVGFFVFVLIVVLCVYIGPNILSKIFENSKGFEHGGQKMGAYSRRHC